ncbi:RAI2 protein, partial [Amia calva]|nr:RAI2 protein [Amia calva]
MEDLYKDTQPGLPVDMGSPQSAVSSTGGGAGGGSGKMENGMTQLITAEAWNINPSGLMKKALSPLVAVPAPPMVSPPTESPGGVALKVAATVLQPICLGDSPVVLPIHLQVAGSATPQMNTTGNTPYVMTSQGPVPLPLILEQQVFQHLNSPMLSQGTACPGISLQNNVLCQNSSLSFGQPPPLDQKPSGPAQEPGILPLLQTPGFSAILQDLFPSQNNLNSSPCHSAASAPTDPFSSNFFPPPPPGQAYSSPLSPLVPPATLLVPYPVIVPLPVPLPIPIPVPIPIPQNADSKGFTDPPKPACTLSKATQTVAKGAPSPVQFQSRDLSLYSSHIAYQVSSPSDGEALDLSMKSLPVQTKQEVPFQQDSVLDLSVTSVRKHNRPGCDPKCSGGNIEIVSTSQTAKVIVSVKDAVPAIFCGKIKGLSGVSTKNFSFKRDGAQESMLQQCYDSKSQAEQRDANDPLKKPLKNRGIKLKKMNSQEIHILPIKKQRLAAFFPRK